MNEKPLINPLRKILSFWLIGAAMVIGIGITLYGFSQQKWPALLPMNSWSSIREMAIFLSSCFIVILIFRFFTKRSISLIVSTIAIFIALIAGEIGPLLAVLFYAVAALALGHIVLKLLKISGDIDDVYQLLVGVGTYASLVSIIAHFPINYAGVYYFGLIVPIWIARSWLLERIKYLRSILLTNSTPQGYQEVLKGLLGTLLLLYFTFAFFPEISFDSLAVHLFVPVHIKINHIWSFNPSYYIWTCMPMLGDWNYSIGYLMAGETCIRFINIGFIYIIAYITQDLVLWAKGDKKMALWGILIFLSTSLTFIESIALNIESIWTCYLLAGLLWIMRAALEKSKENQSEVADVGIIMTGLMLAFAAETKAITLIYLPVLLLPIFLSLKDLVPRYLSSIIKGLICFLLLGSIPYVTAYLTTGNPVFPFYNAYFKSSFYPAVNFNNNLFNLPVNWTLPYQLVFNSQKYIAGTMGGGGFQWLLLLLPVATVVVLLKNRHAIFLFVIGVLLLLVEFHFQTYLRYIFPVYLLFSVLISIAITLSSRLNKSLRICFMILMSITIVLNLLFFTSASWAYRDLPVLQSMIKERRESLLLNRAPIRKAIELVNILNSKSLPVAFFSESNGAGLRADALYIGWYNPKFQDGVNKVDTPQSLAKLLNSYHARYLIVDSFWSMQRLTSKQRASIEDETESIATFGTCSVRVLKKELANKD